MSPHVDIAEHEVSFGAGAKEVGKVRRGDYFRLTAAEAVRVNVFTLVFPIILHRPS